MSDESVALDCKVKVYLVKWDACGPPEGWDGTPLPGHPACIEIIESEDGAEPKVIYRRDSWQT